MKPDLVFALPIATRNGRFIATYSENGLAGLEFPSTVRTRGISRTPQRGLPAGSVRRWHALTTKALKTALAGRRLTKLPPLDFSSGTAFQQRVWGVLRKIAAGRTRSYGQIAKQIGQPKAVRAVGGACGANPIPVFVPCHRAVAANGGLGGFSAGLKWKSALLEREGSLPRQETLP